MSKPPRKWLTALLAFVAAPLAMLYVTRPWWALIYLLAMLGLAVLQFLHPHEWLPMLAQLALLITGVIQGWRFARGWEAGRSRPLYSRWPGLLGIAALAFGCMLVFRAFVFEPFAIPAGSMLPTLPVGGRVLVQKWGYGNYCSYGIRLWHAPVSVPVTRGDVLVFEQPRDRAVHFVKRVVGLPGDRVEIRGKQLWINGQAVPLRGGGEYFDADRREVVSAFVETLDGVDYTVLLDSLPARPVLADEFPMRELCTYRADGLSCTVPAGHYYVLGDNRDNSRDSRYWGFVPADHLVGKVRHVVP